MTKEEAIVHIKAGLDAVDSEMVSTNPEHFKSSEKFIKFMNDADIASFGKWQWANGFNSALVETTIQLKKLPSAQPKTGHWIPVSERLPEELEPVNITWVNHNPESYYKHIKDKPFTATGVYFYGQWYWWSTLCTDMLAEYGHNNSDMIDDDIEITAWMPLPESYKAEREEEAETYPISEDTCRYEANIPSGCSWGECNLETCPFLQDEEGAGNDKL